MQPAKPYSTLSARAQSLPSETGGGAPVDAADPSYWPRIRGLPLNPAFNIAWWWDVAEPYDPEARPAWLMPVGTNQTQGETR